MPAGHTSNNTWLSLITWGFEVCRPVFYDRSFFGFESITESSTRRTRLLTTSRLRVVLSLSLTFSTRRTSGTERNSFAEFVRGPRLAFAHYCPGFRVASQDRLCPESFFAWFPRFPCCFPGSEIPVSKLRQQRSKSVRAWILILARRLRCAGLVLAWCAKAPTAPLSTRQLPRRRDLHSV